MSPSIVMKDGKPFLSVGAAGGPRIITSTLQLIINAIDYGMMMDSAVKSPHMCCLTLDQGLELEEGFSPDTIRILKERGHKIKETSDFGVLLVLPNGIENLDGAFFPGGTRLNPAQFVLTAFVFVNESCRSALCPNRVRCTFPEFFILGYGITSY